MNDVLLGVVFLILGTIIALQFLERFYVVEQHKAKEDKLLEENSRLVKAIIAKNAQDYVMTTSIDKVPTEKEEPKDPDQVDMDNLDDDQFDEALGIKRKKSK